MASITTAATSVTDDIYDAEDATGCLPVLWENLKRPEAVEVPALR